MNIDSQKAQDIQHVQAIGDEYVCHMTSLIKALSIVRTEAVFINKLNAKDTKIASKYRKQGYFAQKTNLIINGCSLSAYAREALIHLAERLPTLFRDSGVIIDQEPNHVSESKDG